MNLYISKFTGKQIDHIIKTVLRIQPRIHVSNIKPKTSVEYYSDEDLEVKTVTADYTGEILIRLNRYGNYTIVGKSISGADKSMQVYVDEYKQFELDFS